MSAEEALRERDFYRSLLELSEHEDPAPLLQEALRILVELTQAREVYIELRDDTEQPPDLWSAAEGCDTERVAVIRRTVSRGIIAEALATGRTVVTADATADARFSDLESVRRHAIEAVLCIPIGRDLPIGVIYLQGPLFEATDGKEVPPFSPFSEQVQEHATLLARSLSPLADHLLRRAKEEGSFGGLGGGIRVEGFERLLGRSRLMSELIRTLSHAAKLNLTLLFTGPSGTGKTLLARAVHAASGRALGPFIELNCGALPEALVENELFGSAPGGHATAQRAVEGKVAAAEGGTLFLDEIGELPLGAQVKLLQLLNDGSYYRLGEAKPRRANIRVLAATNVDLPRAIEEGRFREDLFYRLNVLPVRVPALGERAEDIPPLSHHFCAAAHQRHDLAPVLTLSREGLRSLRLAQWPGNVRQLSNRIESAVVRAHLRKASAVEPRDLFPETAPAGSGDDVLEESEHLDLQAATLRFQRDYVLAVLRRCEWNVSEAARALKLSRSHLHSRIKDWDLRSERET